MKNSAVGISVPLRKLALLSLAGLSATSASYAHSETASKKDNEPRLETVKVTAQKRSEQVQDVPSAVSVVSGDEVGSKEIRSTSDILNRIPNATGWSMESRARPRFFIRGVGANDNLNNTVQAVGVYYDEVYAGSSLFSGAPLYDLERVEVLRGPQGTLWGKNTTGGALHFISRKPTYENQGYGKLTFGNRGQRVGEGAVGGSLVDDRVAGRLSLHYEEQDGPAKNRVSGKGVGDLEDFALRGQLLFDLAPNVDFLLSGNVRRFDGAPQGGYRKATRANGTDNYGYTPPKVGGSKVDYNVDSKGWVDSEGLSGTFNWYLDNGLTLTSITAYQTGEREIINDGDGTPNEISRSYNTNKVNQFSQEVRLSSPKEDRLSWILGGYYFRDNNDSYTATAAVPGAVVAPRYFHTAFEQDTRSLAVFGSLSFKATDRLTLNAGLRQTRESVSLDLVTRQATPANAANYPGAAHWWKAEGWGALGTYTSYDERNTWNNLGYDFTPEFRLADNQLLYFRHASGFRSGNYNVNVNPPNSIADVVQPEKLKSYELGYKSNWLDERLIVNATLFHYDYSNIQLPVNRVINGVFFPTLENAAESDINGFELEVQAQLSRNLRLTTSLGWLDTEFNQFVSGTTSYKGNELPRAPDFNAFIGLDYRLPLANGLGAIGLSTDWRYNSRTYLSATNQTDPNLYQDSFWLGNAQVSYHLPNNQSSVSLFVNNLTDKEYKQQALAASNGSYPYYLGERRLFGVSLAHSF